MKNLIVWVCLLSMSPAFAVDISGPVTTVAGVGTTAAYLLGGAPGAVAAGTVAGTVAVTTIAWTIQQMALGRLRDQAILFQEDAKTFLEIGALSPALSDLFSEIRTQDDLAEADDQVLALAILSL